MGAKDFRSEHESFAIPDLLHQTAMAGFDLEHNVRCQAARRRILFLIITASDNELPI